MSRPASVTGNENVGWSGRRPWAALFWLMLSLGGGAVLARAATGSVAIGQDQAWLLYAAERMLHGVQLYGSQLTETNPPLIIWMSALPVGLAALIGISVPAAFYLAVAAVMLGSAAWCYGLLKGTAYSRTQRWLLAGCVLLAESRPILEALGQREHLLVMLVLPFLVAFGVPRQVALSRWQVVAVSVVAAAGVCLKPQQMLLLAGFLGAVVWRVWRENGERDAAKDAAVHSGYRGLIMAGAVVCAVCAIYGVAVLVFAPLYVRSEMKVLVDTYWAFGTYSIPQLVALDHHFLAYVVAGAALWVYVRRRGLQVSMPGYLLVASVAASIAFDLQHTGFMYQHIPQDLLAELAIFWLAVELAESWFPRLHFAFEAPRWVGAALACAVVVFAGVAGYCQHRVIAAAPVTEPKTLREFYASLPEGTAVMGLSTNPQAVFPYVEQYRLEMAGRFVHLWMLPAVEQNEWYRAGGPKPRKVLNTAAVSSLGELQRDEVAADIEMRKPMYVVVPRCVKAFDCEAIGEAGFGIVEWLSRDAGFRREWAGYRQVRVVEAKDQGLIYDVYARGER